MRAMILAAGRGERLRPLTDETPKPLLSVGGRPLIEYAIESLVKNGFSEIVINLAHLAERIETELGDGRRYGARICYSRETAGALETGGGIKHALRLLGNAPFLAVNGDIWSDFCYRTLLEVPLGLAHLVLVHNPPHHPSGDFALRDAKVVWSGVPRYTFSGIGVYRPQLFLNCPAGKFPLAPVLRRAMSEGEVSGEVFDGVWMDVGTPERYEALNRMLSKG